MIPKSMRTPVWLAPACILNFTLGVFLLAVYFFPDFAPRMHLNMIRRGVYVIIPFVVVMNVIAPVMCLWYCSWVDERVAAGEMDEEDA
jgi:hypothetical protein